MQGSIAIPIHNKNGELIGYAGLDAWDQAIWTLAVDAVEEDES